jgi:uncharacterized protein
VTGLVEVYHGTSDWSARRIHREGLKPYRGCGRVYVTSDRGRAAFFAAMWAAHFKDKHGGGDRGTVFAFRVPADDLMRNIDDPSAVDEYIVRGGVPASAIDWYLDEDLGIDLDAPGMRRALDTVQRLIDTGTGGPGCPAGCRGTRPVHRTLAEVALSVATPFAVRSRVHGPAHWYRVAQIGRYLIETGEPWVDPEVVRLFAMFHDTQRLNDGRDRDHGRRAAEVALEHEATAHLTSQQREKLAVALAEHADGKRYDDDTIGVCVDSDRLDLWRLGRRPLPRLLSTVTARDPEVIEFARELQDGDAQTWADAAVDLYAPVIMNRA